MPQDAPLCPPKIYHKSNHLFYNRVGSCTTQYCCITVDENKIFSDSKMKGKRQIKPVKLARKRLLQHWQALICSTTVITTHASWCKHQEPDTLGIPSVQVFFSSILLHTLHPWEQRVNTHQWYYLLCPPKTVSAKDFTRSKDLWIHWYWKCSSTAKRTGKKHSNPHRSVL